ncbi:hypothetical protein FGO68_gene16820 [Halteria grandinella]|uniref:C2H2-type domain-containing protein n=1 Tax=Halteria grandinella TaxID=5974 RepID=A0A8J8NYR0_HALGN|nr:hypothetical protein FGO68_gene16820 [Halteria grandinella]
MQSDEIVCEEKPVNSCLNTFALIKSELLTALTSFDSELLRSFRPQECRNEFQNRIRSRCGEETFRLSHHQDPYKLINNTAFKQQELRDFPAHNRPSLDDSKSFSLQSKYRSSQITQTFKTPLLRTFTVGDIHFRQREEEKAKRIAFKVALKELVNKYTAAKTLARLLYQNRTEIQQLRAPTSSVKQLKEKNQPIMKTQDQYLASSAAASTSSSSLQALPLQTPPKSKVGQLCNELAALVEMQGAVTRVKALDSSTEVRQCNLKQEMEHIINQIEGEIYREQNYYMLSNTPESRQQERQYEKRQNFWGQQRLGQSFGRMQQYNPYQHHLPFPHPANQYQPPFSNPMKDFLGGWGLREARDLANSVPKDQRNPLVLMEAQQDVLTEQVLHLEVENEAKRQLIAQHEGRAGEQKNEGYERRIDPAFNLQRFSRVIIDDLKPKEAQPAIFVISAKNENGNRESHHNIRTGDSLSEITSERRTNEDYGKTKRIRRSAVQIDRTNQCTYPGCSKTYGSEGSLSQHIRLKHPGHFLSYKQSIIMGSAQRQIGE